MSGIGPFRGEESIDFDRLTRSGLFLIEGPTGAGKSTIIDAIVYALYGSVAGGRESTTDRIRSDLADSATASYVELEFDVGGRSYAIWRQPAYSRPKLRGDGFIKENAKQSLRSLDGSLEPITDAREIAAQVQRLLGLSVEHFRKLVVLPQGEFDALLRASPADRFEVLGRLIDDGFLARVQEDLVTRAREAEARRAEIRAHSQGIAITLCSRAREALEDVPDAESLDSDDVDALRRTLQVRVTDARQRVAALTDPATAAAEAAVVAGRALTQARQAASSRAALAQARAALPQPLRESPADRLRQRRSEVAGIVARLEPFEAWEAACDVRAARTAELAEAARQARAHVADLVRQAQDLPAQRADRDRRRQAAVIAAAGLAQHSAEVARLEVLVSAAHDLRSREAALTEATAAAASATAESDRLRAALISAREHRVTLLERRLAQSAADLASRLHADQPCPVCGSRVHPHTATAGDADLVTDAEVESAEAALVAAEDRHAVAHSAAEAARAATIPAQSAVDTLRGRLADVDASMLTSAVATAQQALADARAGQTLADSLAAEIADLDVQISALEDQRTKATAAAAEAEARVRADQDSNMREAAALHEAVGSQATAAATAALAREEATLIDAALDAFEAIPVSTPEVDISVLEAALTAAQAGADDARAQLHHAHEALTRLSATFDAVESLADSWIAAHAEIAEVLAATETAISLGALVSAQGKANTLRLTLQSYAVQRRFRTVLDAATLHLERMSGSHFAFELDESVGRGHSGLGIAVRDQWSGALRDPKALSGGETFIASLALALGLADVVREESGGVDLQTLFVDEGFGSLDQESLQHVLDQLDALRSRGRMVGVISHVTEMKDWVHDRVVVVPGPRGAGSHLIVAA